MTNFAEALEKNGYFAFTSKGISMMPLLRERKDIIVIRQIKDELKKNDVVLFVRDSGEYVLHRITKVHANGLYTITGDNCYNGEIVNRNSIIGILTEIKRDNKKVLVTDKEYLRYVKTVPFRRFVLKARVNFNNRIKKPIYRILKKIKEKFVCQH